MNDDEQIELLLRSVREAKIGMVSDEERDRLAREIFESWPSVEYCGKRVSTEANTVQNVKGEPFTMYVTTFYYNATGETENDEAEMTDILAEAELNHLNYLYRLLS